MNEILLTKTFHSTHYTNLHKVIIMKKRFIFISILAIMTAACAESEWEPASQTDVSTSPHSENNRTLEEALAYADDWFAQMDEPTRSEGRRVESVEYVSSASRTRSGDADTLMYLVNYEDNAGFALLGRPATSKAIYAISEEGSLDMSDTVYNKPLAMFMASAREDIICSTIFPPTHPIIPPVIVDTTFIGLHTRIIREKKPMLDSLGKVSIWSQDYPYNLDTPIFKGEKGYVGCGALAVGMLMTYYKFPETINDTIVPWSLIIDKNNRIAISKLLETLASEKYLNSQYTTYNDRRTKIENIRPTFASLGYAMGNALNGAWLYREENNTTIDNLDVLMTFMESGDYPAEAAPVILYGGVNKNEELRGIGHIWITDGFLQKERYNSYSINIPPQKLDPQFHMVWGWGGKANGYYTYFITQQRLQEISSENLEEGYPDQFWNLRLFGRYTVFRKND